MITDVGDAWVIHKYWSGDTSARIVFFTENHGLVTCLYKGGRTPKKQSLVQAFMPLWLAMDVRGDMHYVRTLEATRDAMPLMGDALFAGLYINELVYRVLQPSDPSPTLYAVYVQALHSLVQITHRLALEAVLRHFEWALLTASGYQISLTHEAKTANPIDANQTYIFVAGEGFILAEKGFSGTAILALAQNELNDAYVLNVAKHIMRRAIDHLLDGQVIQARSLYFRGPT